MKVTLNSFQSLFAFYELQPGFVDSIAGMGYKSSPEDEHFTSCYRHLRSCMGDVETTDVGGSGML